MSKEVPLTNGVGGKVIGKAEIIGGRIVNCTITDPQAIENLGLSDELTGFSLVPEQTTDFDMELLERQTKFYENGIGLPYQLSENVRLAPDAFLKSDLEELAGLKDEVESLKHLTRDPEKDFKAFIEDSQKQRLALLGDETESLKFLGVNNPGLPNCTDTNVNTYSNDLRKQRLALFNDENPYGVDE